MVQIWFAFSDVMNKWAYWDPGFGCDTLEMSDFCFTCMVLCFSFIQIKTQPKSSCYKTESRNWNCSFKKPGIRTYTSHKSWRKNRRNLQRSKLSFNSLKAWKGLLFMAHRKVSTAITESNTLFHGKIPSG
jgi:hypothetical protein